MILFDHNNFPFRFIKEFHIKRRKSDSIIDERGITFPPLSSDFPVYRTTSSFSDMDLANSMTVIYKT
jgi:hypothetical protein